MKSLSKSDKKQLESDITNYVSQKRSKKIKIRVRIRVVRVGIDAVVPHICAFSLGFDTSLPRNWTCWHILNRLGLDSTSLQPCWPNTKLITSFSLPWKVLFL